MYKYKLASKPGAKIQFTSGPGFCSLPFFAIWLQMEDNGGIREGWLLMETHICTLIDTRGNRKEQCCNWGDICRLLFLTPSFFMAIPVPIMVLWWFHLSFFCPPLATVSLLLFLSEETCVKYVTMQFHWVPMSSTICSACDLHQLVVTHCSRNHPNIVSPLSHSCNFKRDAENRNWVRDQINWVGAIQKHFFPKDAFPSYLEYGYLSKVMNISLKNNGYLVKTMNIWSSSQPGLLIILIAPLGILPIHAAAVSTNFD